MSDKEIHSDSFGVEKMESTNRDTQVCAGLGTSPCSALEVAGVSQVSVK